MPLKRRITSRKQGGGGNPPPPPPPTANLFFDMPDTSASPKKALAHFFYFPISLDNAPPTSDYWSTQWLTNPTQCGGFTRNRPIPHGTLPGDYQLIDANTEIVNAKSAYVDGFFCNIMWADKAAPAAWPLARFTKLIQAAQAYPGFLVVPMLDVSTLGQANTTTMAQFIQEYYGLPSTWMDGTTMIVGSYIAAKQPENVINPPSWFNAVIASCAAIGITVKFAHVWSGNQHLAPNYAASAYATGIWGPTADAAIPIGSSSPTPASVHARGEKFLGPVWIQDERAPGATSIGPGVWAEALNTLALRNFWTEIINVNAEIVQMCTWNDYTEGSIFGRSAHCAMVPSDISAWYQARWKTGTFPPIVRDAVYLSYRNRTSGVTHNGGQINFMQKWSAISATRFSVEALVFLTAPANVTITVAGVPTVFNNVAAGMTSLLANAAAGNVSVTVVRSAVTVASITSPVPIRSTLWTDSWAYFMFGSLRGTGGQFDCGRTSAGAIPVPPPDTPPPPPNPPPATFFTQPDVSASPKLSLAHYFGPYPTSILNEVSSVDYYAENYLDPDSTAYGGQLRDRPMPRPVLPSNWRDLDAAEDIRQMKQAGCDGAVCTIMSIGLPGQWYQGRYTILQDVASADFPGFKVIPNIDMHGLSLPGATPTGPATPAQIAPIVAEYHGKTSTLTIGGAFVITALKAENFPPSFYQSIISELAGMGITAKFIMRYHNFSTAATYASVQIGMGPWGPGADPTVTAGYGTGKSNATALGIPHFAPIWVQDVRPNSSLYCEARNTENLVVSWQRAIADNSEMVQLNTWADYSEGSQQCLSTARGRVVIELNSYYTAWWKSGSAPTIIADAMFLSYRNHIPGAPVLHSQAQALMSNRFGTAPRYSIEALVFLTAPATVIVRGVSFSAPAGISAHLVPVTAAGAVTASIVRSGVTVVTLNPPTPIRSTMWVQDMAYHMFSSVSGTAGQFDATYTSSGVKPTYPA